jgi:hypothetical protein
MIVDHRAADNTPCNRGIAHYPSPAKQASDAKSSLDRRRQQDLLSLEASGSVPTIRDAQHAERLHPVDDHFAFPAALHGQAQWRRRNGPDPERSARVIAFAPNELPAGVEPARRLWRGCAR